jgi:hypothetical protein
LVDSYGNAVSPQGEEAVRAAQGINRLLRKNPNLEAIDFVNGFAAHLLELDPVFTQGRQIRSVILARDGRWNKLSALKLVEALRDPAGGSVPRVIVAEVNAPVQEFTDYALRWARGLVRVSRVAFPAHRVVGIACGVAISGDGRAWTMENSLKLV